MEPFIGQIMMFGGNFAPRGWALCDGQLLDIASHTALFSILGTTYGGDGRTTFGLPDLRGRVAMHPGNGPGLSPRSLGEKAGSEENQLAANQIPSVEVDVALKAVASNANTRDPGGNVLAKSRSNVYSSQEPGTLVDLDDASATGTSVGGTEAVNNVQPYQCVNYIIALQGVFPSRS